MILKETRGDENNNIYGKSHSTVQDLGVNVARSVKSVSLKYHINKQK